MRARPLSSFGVPPCGVRKAALSGNLGGMIGMDQNRQKVVNEADDPIGQQRRQQEASQALVQGGINAHMDAPNSMFSYYRGNLDEDQKRARG